MTSANPTREELGRVKRRISETMQDIQRKQRELEETQRLIDSIPGKARDQMMSSASESRSRRRNAKKTVTSAEDYYSSLAEKMAQINEAISRLWLKLNDLQAQEQDLEAQGNNHWPGY